MAKKGESLTRLEDQYIQKYDSILTGYNKRRGGGGGASSRTSRVKLVAEHAFRLTTPKKYYRIRRLENGRLKVEWTPSKKTFRNAIYVFKHIDAGWSPTVKKASAACHSPKVTRYVGKTGDVDIRTLKHLNDAVHPEADRGKKPLARALLADPSKVRVGVLANQQPNLDRLEVLYIQDKENEGALFNLIGGGGGSNPR